MPRKASADRLIHDLGRALMGARAPTARSIASDPTAALNMLLRYAAGGSAAASPGILSKANRILRMLGIGGSFGRLLGGLGGSKSLRGGSARSRSLPRSIRALADAAEAMAQSAGGVAPPRRPPRTPTSAPSPGSPGQPPPGWAGGGFSGRFPGSTLEFGAEPPLPGQQSPFGEEVLTPNSTNVFSISYMRRSGERTGTLYVTYKAAKLNTGSLSSGHKRVGKGLSRRQLIGRAGHTVSGKTGERGPQYAYLRVPPNIYTRLKAVASRGGQVGPGVKSPGTGVWELLRTRGSAWGHKFNYVLVSGSISIQEGMSGVYIPRKATQKGFATRSVRDIGSKTFQSSTLPARGFGQRSSRRS